jgi:hypothetical protein
VSLLERAAGLGMGIADIVACVRCKNGVGEVRVELGTVMDWILGKSFAALG